ncbi:MarR family winged helix-turn-helix transcriptional regulator [Microbulbifer variabilis]|uniref:MarR family winged helix-turn-helix transcriptional regulator n=1 Tax=Microbulbifer variabilis TaxID=266805 RepID=UPI001CFF3077|nr:MarR family transcriptional regulator [Microbulbifer variabilis]
MASDERKASGIQPDDVDRFIEQRSIETPEIDTSGMAIFGRIYRLAARITPHMEALFARHGLERGEFDVLATLQREGPPYRLTPTALCASLMVSSGGLTHRLKRLEKSGWIERVPSEEDKRSLIVVLTDAGYDLARRAFDEDMRLECDWLASLDAGEQRKLAELLRKLGHAVPVFGRESDPPG